MSKNLSAAYKTNKRYIITFFAVLFSALLQTFVLQTFLNPSDLLSSGFTGIAILINRISMLYGYSLSISTLVIVLNLPVAIVCYKTIGKKFVFFSFLQVIFFSIFTRVLSFDPLFDDVILNVCFGGTLYQDLPAQVSSSISHHQTPPYDQPVHTVSVLPETPLAALLEQETLAVNSYHHQSILKLAEALQPMAVAPDGLIESVWLPEKAFVWGVQWHPEYDYQKNVASQQIFQAFVQAAYKQKK